MAARTEQNDPITFASELPMPERNVPRVRIFLPLREDDEAQGVKVDHYEHVTISNEKGTTRYRVKRGEYVDVTIPVFEQLKQRYPNI